MRDDFDLYEFKNQLTSKLRENSLTGIDASNKVIAYLRDSIYPKLNEQEMDSFVVEMADHFDMEPPSYRLPEGDLNGDTLPNQLTITLDDLNYDIIKKLFDGSTALPNPDDSFHQVIDEDDLESWKLRTKSRYGNINLRLDSGSSSPWREVKVLDNEFTQDKNDYIDAKADALKEYPNKD